MSGTLPRYSIVVPTYNERDNLPRLAERVFAAMSPQSTELLIIDDDSPDGTSAAAAEIAAQTGGPIRCVVRRNERGLATAVIRGLREARGEICVVMDADLSHPPEAIPKLIEALNDPAVNLAVGSRFVTGGRVDLDWPLHRRLNSLFGRLLARPLTPVKDMMAGFFALRRREVELDRLSPIGYKILLEIIVRQRFRNVIEIPIAFADRAAGVTKLNVGEQMRYLRHLARLYSVAIFGGGSRRR